MKNKLILLKAKGFYWKPMDLIEKQMDSIINICLFEKLMDSIERPRFILKQYFILFETVMVSIEKQWILLKRTTASIEKPMASIVKPLVSIGKQWILLKSK